MHISIFVTLVLVSSVGLVSSLPSTDYSTYQTDRQIASHFKKILSPEAQVFLPTDSNFSTETIQAWNANNAPTYRLSVKPATEVDVQEIINFASTNHIPFLGRGGGHSYTTTVGLVQNGIEIDTSGFYGVHIDTVANTLTAGGNVHFANITGAVYAAGREIPVGACSCVGLIGATLGGGTGNYGGLHGLLIDSLESVRIVTGSGEILTASENQNPDLFWGLRGAGHNFGIITNATFKIYPFTNGGQVMSADMRIPVSKNQSIWEFVKSYENNMPDELSIDVAGLYSEQFGGTYFLISITYAGPLSTGTKIIQPLLDLTPLTHNITSIPWSLLETQGRYGVDAEACIKGTNHNVFGINLYKIDVLNLVDMSNYVDEVFRLYPAFRFALFSLSKYATRVIESVPDDATAYPYRNTNAYVHYDVPFPPTSNTTLSTLSTRIGTHGRSILQRGSGSPTLEVYVNFAHGDEGPVAWYSERKLGRLRALKRRYDPKGLFGWFNGVDGPVGA